MANELPKCPGGLACKVANCAGYLMCSFCGYQEDEDYEFE